MERIKLFFAENRIRIIAFVLILVLMVCSATIFGKIFTNPQTYSDTIQSIDEKKVTVLSVSAAIAGSSTLLASVPDDATTPLANELMDLSTYLLLVVCILVLEKSLLTVFGAVSCYVLFPVACVFGLAYIVQKKQVLISWAIKLVVLALALLTIVPAAMKISDYIYDVNQIKIEQKVENAIQPTEPETSTPQQEDTRPWWQKLWDNVTDAVEDVADTISTAAQEAIQKGKEALNNFTDAVAVFVIAYCAIPIFVIFLFLWLLKILFGININITPNKLNLKRLSGKREQEEADLVLTK